MCSHAAGDTSSKNKLVVNLARKDNHVDGAGPPNPILKLDGVVEDMEVSYSFVSDYGKEDLDYALSQILQNCDASLVSRSRLQPRSTLKIKTDAGKTFSWPDIPRYYADMFKDLQRIKK